MSGIFQFFWTESQDIDFKAFSEEMNKNVKVDMK